VADTEREVIGGSAGSVAGMTTLLVTGAAGFIGSHFVRHRVAQPPEDRVVALDALTEGAWAP